MANNNQDGQNFAGVTTTPGIKNLVPEAAVIVKNSSTMSAPELGNMLNVTTSCGDIGDRTRKRPRYKFATETKRIVRPT